MVISTIYYRQLLYLNYDWIKLIHKNLFDYLSERRKIIGLKYLLTMIRWAYGNIFWKYEFLTVSFLKIKIKIYFKNDNEIKKNKSYYELNKN